MNEIARFITDEQVEAALDYLRDSAAKIGELTEAAVKADHMVKHILALEMKKYEGSAVSQEREAKASDAYVSAITTDAEAAGALAAAKALREAAAMKIEAWRSQQANFRAMKL